MTLAITAAALYLRAKAQFHHLTHSTPQADHNHPPRPIAVAFPLHTAGTRKRRRPRSPLAAASRRLMCDLPTSTELTRTAEADLPPLRGRHRLARTLA